jgi:Uma2 family endonuclease
MANDPQVPEIPDVVLDFSALDRLPTDKDLPSDEFGDPVALRSMPTGMDLPYDDGEPMESPWHRDAMVLLIDSIGTHWRDRADFFVGGNMFVYFSPARVFNKQFRGPDFFVVKGVERHRPRVSWVAWEENSRLPDVVIELISPSTAAIDRGEKKNLYGNVFRTAEYFCYDPLADRLEGWRRTDDRGYTPIPVEPDGRMWCQQLGLFVGRWGGTYLETTGRLLRFFTADGTLILTGRETDAQQAQSESLRASIEAQRASFEAARANTEATARADALARAAAEAAARADAEQRAETETRRATAAESEVERLTRELDILRQQLPPTTP